VGNRLALGDGFLEIGGVGHTGLEDGRAVLLAEHGLVNLVDGQPGVVHREQEPEQVQPRVGSGGDQADRFLHRP
jgi:hypothetical protein